MHFNFYFLFTLISLVGNHAWRTTRVENVRGLEIDVEEKPGVGVQEQVHAVRLHSVPGQTGREHHI